MATMTGPLGPDRPEHESLSFDARRIEARIKPLMATFTGRMQMAFEQHGREPRPETLGLLTKEIRFFMDELNRASRLYNEAHMLADRAKAFGAAHRYSQYAVNVEVGLRAVSMMWDTLARNAVAKGVLAPLDELHIAASLNDNVINGIQLLRGAAQKMLDTAKRGRRRVSQEVRETFTSHVTTLIQICETAMDAVDRAREMAPDDPTIGSVSRERVVELHRQIEIILGIQQSAVDAGVMGAPPG